MTELDAWFKHAEKQETESVYWGRIQNEAVFCILTEFTDALLELNPKMVVQRKPWIAGAHRQHQSLGGYLPGFNRWAVREHARRFERPVFRSPDSLSYLVDAWVEAGNPTSEEETWRRRREKYE